MGIRRTRVQRKGSDQEGISTEIGEGDDAGPRVAPGELLSEWLQVCAQLAKSRDIDQNELKLAIGAGAYYRRALPAVGLEGGVEESVREPIPEACLTNPELEGIRVGEGPFAPEDADTYAPLPRDMDLGFPHRNFGAPPNGHALSCAARPWKRMPRPANRPPKPGGRRLGAWRPSGGGVSCSAVLGSAPSRRSARNPRP